MAELFSIIEITVGSSTYIFRIKKYSVELMFSMKGETSIAPGLESI